jgi:hypothetical protein
VVTKIKHGSLVVCLFLFLFVVIGGGLHLNPGGTFLAAATGTPLVIHVFNRRWAGRAAHDPQLSLRNPGCARHGAEGHAAEYTAPCEIDTVVRQ